MVANFKYKTVKEYLDSVKSEDSEDDDDDNDEEDYGDEDYEDENDDCENEEDEEDEDEKDEEEDDEEEEIEESHTEEQKKAYSNFRYSYPRWYDSFSFLFIGFVSVHLEIFKKSVFAQIPLWIIIPFSLVFILGSGCYLSSWKTSEIYRAIRNKNNDKEFFQFIEHKKIESCLLHRAMHSFSKSDFMKTAICEGIVDILTIMTVLNILRYLR